MLAFASAGVIFYNILEVHSTYLEKKKKIVANFPFLMDPINGKSKAKVFC